MNLKSRIIKRFKELWGHKCFRVALIVHFFYFILSIALFFIFYREKNDFYVFYKAGDIFINDIENLYSQTNYLWDYRYLPLSALFYIPYSLFTYEVAFIVFTLFNVFLNILICTIMYRIIIIVKGEDHEKDDKRVIYFICFYIVSFPNGFNYVLGQINLYVSFFILLSLYIFIKYEKIKWQFIGSIILGMSIIIKPTTFFLIPFLVILNIDFKRRKLTFNFLGSTVRFIGVLIPFSLNIILFLLHRNLWIGFLNTNFTGSNPIALNYSFSISKLITNFCYFYNIPFNALVILIIVLIIIGGLGFIIFIFGKLDKNSIIYGYAFGLIIMLLVYFDSWDHHLLNLIPIIIIIMFNIPRNSPISYPLKRSLFFFAFLDLAFVGIWHLIFPLFPYNFESTFFLLLTFYAISKYYVIKKDKAEMYQNR